MGLKISDFALQQIAQRLAGGLPLCGQGFEGVDDVGFLAVLELVEQGFDPGLGLRLFWE